MVTFVGPIRFMALESLDGLKNLARTQAFVYKWRYICYRSSGGQTLRVTTFVCIMDIYEVICDLSFHDLECDLG